MPVTGLHSVNFAIQKTKAPIASPKGHTDTIGTYLLSHIGCAKDSGEENSRVFSPESSWKTTGFSPSKSALAGGSRTHAFTAFIISSVFPKVNKNRSTFSDKLCAGNCYFKANHLFFDFFAEPRKRKDGRQKICALAFSPKMAEKGCFFWKV